MLNSSTEFNELRLSRYERYWEYLERRDRGESVSTPKQYLQRVGCTPESNQYDNELKINKTEARHALTRFYPYNEQPILLALEEPRLNKNEYQTPERINLAKSNCNPKEMAEISVNYYCDYFAGNNSPGTKFKKGILEKFINEKIDTTIGPDEDDEIIEYLYPPDGDDTEYKDKIQRDICSRSGVWEDFYVTNTFALDNFKSFTYKNENVRRKPHILQFFDEIQKSGAKLAILSGDRAWNSVTTGIEKNRGPIDDELTLVTSPSEVPADEKFSTNVTEVQGCLYEDSNGMFYIPIPHIGGRFQDEHWKSDDILEPAVHKIAKEVSW